MLQPLVRQPLDSRLTVLDSIIDDAIAQHQIPGAVVIVGHDGQVVYRKAYGSRAIVPRHEEMTANTIFDCASLTKVLATTPALMQLWEQGKFRMNDPVAKYLPDFAQNGKLDITIRQLLVHYSGLPEDLDLTKKWEGKDTGYRMAFEVTPERSPGAAFSYSDINFVVLGALVESYLGESLDDYAAKHVFDPLGMKETRSSLQLRGCLASLQPKKMKTTTCYEGPYTTLRPAVWAELLAMQEYFLPPTISRYLRRPCLMAAAPCSLRRQSPK